MIYHIRNRRHTTTIYTWAPRRVRDQQTDKAPVTICPQNNIKLPFLIVNDLYVNTSSARSCDEGPLHFAAGTLAASVGPTREADDKALTSQYLCFIQRTIFWSDLNNNLFGS